MSRRSLLAAGISLAWITAFAWLVKREYFRTTSERLAEAALSVAPGTAFYRMDLGSQQVGFASTTVDTLSMTLEVTDLLVLEVPTPTGMRRTRARTRAVVSRALRPQRLDASGDGPDGAFTAHGNVTGDTVLALMLSSRRDSEPLRLRLTHPLVLPSLLPLRLAFGGAGALKPGRRFDVRVFDPRELVERDVAVTIGPESTLVVPDSAAFDSTTMTWTAAHLDTLRAFRIDQISQGLATRSWIDAQGRVVRATGPTGLTLERSAYEIAYQNFRHRDTTRLVKAEARANTEIVRSTALEARVPVSGERPRQLRVRIAGAGVDVSQLRLDGGRQRRSGDTLSVTQEAATAFAASYALPARDSSFRTWLAADLLMQSDAPSIRAQARAIVGGERDPARAAAALVHWVFGAVRPEAPDGAPNALAVLRRRSGDCNERTVLFVALARAAGLPARPVGGLLAIGRRFYYHAWAEVYLGDWVAVDPTLDQFPADAGHLRFIANGLARQTELLRFLGRVRVDVL